MKTRMPCQCKTLYEHQQFDACMLANGMEPAKFKEQEPDNRYAFLDDRNQFEAF